MLELINNTKTISKVGYAVIIDPTNPQSFLYATPNSTKVAGIVAESAPYRAKCKIATIGDKALVAVVGNIVKDDVLRLSKTDDRASLGASVFAKSGDAPYLRIGVALRSGNGLIPVILDLQYTNTESTGDLQPLSSVLTRFASSGLVYGSMYGYNTGTQISVPGIGIANKVQINAFTDNGESNFMTPDHTNDHITVGVSGIYFVSVSLTSYSGGGLTFVAGFSVFKNNGATLFESLHAHRQLAGGGGDVASVSISGIISLTVGDTVEVWLYNDTNTVDIYVDDITMSLIMISG